jgi:hypothetical protein
LTWRITSPERSTPGPLPYQRPKHTVMGALAAQFRLLAAPERGGSKILVQAGLEYDVGLASSCFLARIICISTAPKVSRDSR